MNAKQPRTPCKNCGDDPARPEYVYCSNQCQRDYQFKGWLADFAAGKDVGPRTAKRILIQIVGEKCSRCGWRERNPATGKVPVELEHADGDFRNNTKSNVCLLCPNCHSLTPTFRALNRGNGREFRRKASVAQLAQQSTCNAPSGGSIPSAGSKIESDLRPWTECTHSGYDTRTGTCYRCSKTGLPTVERNRRNSFRFIDIYRLALGPKGESVNGKPSASKAETPSSNLGSPAIHVSPDFDAPMKLVDDVDSDLWGV